MNDRDRISMQLGAAEEATGEAQGVGRVAAIGLSAANHSSNASCFLTLWRASCTCEELLANCARSALSSRVDPDPGSARGGRREGCVSREQARQMELGAPSESSVRAGATTTSERQSGWSKLGSYGRRPTPLHCQHTQS